MFVVAVRYLGPQRKYNEYCCQMDDRSNVKRVIMIKSRLTLRQLVLSVHLGVTPEERRYKQSVYVDIQIDYADVLAACEQDTLSDTVCYSQLANLLQQVCDRKAYRLIEALSHALFQQMKMCLTTSAKISVTVIKNPPLANLQQASFTLSELS